MSVNDPNDPNDLDFSSSEQTRNTVVVEQIIEKAMLDGQGNNNNKGYFTKDDFVYTATMTPNLHMDSE